MVAPSLGSNSLKEYLKRYSNDEEEKKKKKKKKDKGKTKPAMNGVIVVDEDPVWQKPVQIEEEDDESQDEEKPQVDEDIEVKRMKRLEQIKARRPFGAISGDGSGWVSVSDNAKYSTADDSNLDISPPHRHKARSDVSSPRHEIDPSTTVLDNDMSPPRKRRVRCDTPSPEPKDDDMSPPRRHHRQSRSPPHRHDRKSRSPPQRPDDIDISPPRKQMARFDTPSPEPNSDPDLSPRRRSQHRLDTRVSAVESDLSPPRKKRDDRRQQSVLASDLSPPRKRRDGRNQQSVSASDLSPPRKTMKELDRPKTGLVSGKDIKEEITKAKKEDWLRFQKMDPSMSGRNAEGIRRDKKTGARLSKEEIESLQKKDEKPKIKRLGLKGKGTHEKGLKVIQCIFNKYKCLYGSGKMFKRCCNFLFIIFPCKRLLRLKY